MNNPQKPIKVYVPVEVAFDENGHMYPRLIHWEDGKTYEIDRILDVRPAPAARAGGQGDRPHGPPVPGERPECGRFRRSCHPPNG